MNLMLSRFTASRKVGVRPPTGGCSSGGGGGGGEVIEFNPADLKLDLAPPPPPPLSSLAVGEARLSSRVCAALLKAPADEQKQSDPQDAPWTEGWRETEGDGRPACRFLSLC